MYQVDMLQFYVCLGVLLLQADGMPFPRDIHFLSSKCRDKCLSLPFDCYVTFSEQNRIQDFSIICAQTHDDMHDLELRQEKKESNYKETDKEGNHRSKYQTDNQDVDASQTLNEDHGEEIPNAKDSTHQDQNENEAQMRPKEEVVQTQEVNQPAKAENCRMEGTTVELIRPKATWDDASFRCYNNGQLVTIDCAAKQEAVEKLLYKENTTFKIEPWIGLKDHRGDNTFAWIDGSPLGYHKWAAGEPSHVSEGKSQDCGVIKLGKMWYASNCSMKRSYICELAVTGPRP